MFCVEIFGEMVSLDALEMEVVDCAIDLYTFVCLRPSYLANLTVMFLCVFKEKYVYRFAPLDGPHVFQKTSVQRM